MKVADIAREPGVEPGLCPREPLGWAVVSHVECDRRLQPAGVPVETDTSLPALRVIRVLEQLKESRGLPEMILLDNGPEFVSRKLDMWCKDNKVTLAFIQPGKPMQNGYVERLNGSLRNEFLNAYVFRTLVEVRHKVEQWMLDYSWRRSHSSLGYKTPMELIT